MARDGRVVATVERTRGALGDQDLIKTAAELGEVVSKDGVQRVSARVEVSDGPGVISAVPVTARISSLQSIAFVYDLKASPLGTAFEVPTSAADGGVMLADGKGKALLGKSSGGNGRGEIERKIAGTDWTVRRESSIVPSAVAPWIYIALLALVVFVAVTSALRDRERKRLRREVDEAGVRIAALKRFADDVLRAESSEELARVLASAVVSLGIGSGAGVRMAKPQAEELVEGEQTGNITRMAITGGSRSLAELRVWNRGELDDDSQSLLNALVATCGTAMNTLDVLERERSTAGELAKLDHMRVNLLSTVAHELRSPLTAVKGVLELLSMTDGLSEKQEEYVGVASTRTDALISLIADLLDASLLESGQLRLDTKRLDARDAIQHALGAEIAAHPDSLIIDVAEDLKLTADPVRLGQILRNLVSNAFRYGAAPVAVLADRVGDRARIVVVDSGKGVSVADRERIFSRFVQAQDGEESKSGGVGIGLALVRSLVGLHGGEIELSGASGRQDAGPSGALSGARFSLTFPDVTPDSQSVGTVHPLDDVRSATAATSQTGT
jgi:signal transduction histidine kinase